MSTTIDQRVVEMQFDNAHFERNVATTMSSLDKLKQSLRLSDATKGFENVGTAVKGVNLSGLSSAAETVGLKFSAMYTIADQALRNITNSAMNAGKRIVSALTIDPIKTGFSEYETQINAVQTILANTKSKGTSLNDVNKALDELNTYADKTIYNFTEMTRNIGTFTAAGIDLDTSVNAIQGIANLAAVSGSTSQQASTAMYQLSQALSAGTVRLMDWNSVVNAGMGGEMFQNALRETSELLGTGAEAAIEAEGSFRESLKDGWLTAEVLTETLKKFTSTGAIERVAEYTDISAEAVSATLESAKAQYGEADAIKYASEALAKKSGKSAEEIQATLEFAQNAEDAATKVKTLTQLWDTLKESAQSGWTQTWEIIVGDFEEAKALFTKVSDTIGKMISESSEARNKLLSGALGEDSATPYKNVTNSMLEWSDAQLESAGYTEKQIAVIRKLGQTVKETNKPLETLTKNIVRPTGRELLIESLWNSFEALLKVINPIKEAFREIFPAMSSNQLYEIIEAFNTFTKKLIISDETAKKIKTTFKGVFAALDIGITFVKEIGSGILDLVSNFTGFSGSILDMASAFGTWLSNLRDTVKNTDILGKSIDKVTDFVSKLVSKLKEFASSVKESFSSTRYEAFSKFLNLVWKLLSKIASAFGEAFISISDALISVFDGSYIDNIFNAGLFAGLLMGVKKFVDTLRDMLDDSGGFFDNIKGVLDDVRGCFESFQNNLNAEALKKIATAIAILAASILVIAFIDPERLNESLGAIAVLFTELVASMGILTKLSGSGIKGAIKASAIMVSMSVAVLILSAALKVLSTIDSDAIGRGLVAIGALMAELAIFLRAAKFDGKIKKAAVGIVLISASMLILAKAVKNFGSMDWEEIGKGLAAIGVLLGELAIFTRITGNAKHVVATGVSMILLGAAMKVLTSSMKDFAAMSWEEIGKGLSAMAGSLVAIAIAMRLLPKNMLGIGVGFAVVSASMIMLADVMKTFSGMSWEEIGRGLTVMGGALLELVIALNLMKGTIGGAAALIIAAGALAILAPVMKTLGDLSWEQIIKGLVTIAAAFTVVGVAGLLLTPLLPTIIGLAGAFVLFGAATIGIGAGLTLIGIGLSVIAAGFTAVAVAGTAGATAVVTALSIIILGIADLIPQIAEKLGEAIVAFAKVIGECAPQIAEAVLKLVFEVLHACEEYAPQIVDSLLGFLIGVLDALAGRLPELIVAAVNVISAFFQGVVDALSGLDTETLFKGIAGVALMSGLMFALSSVAALIPGAMVGVLGMGVVIAELAGVLAAIGLLAQIPGLEWLIGEGGDLLQTIGTAIGQFFGGILGGIAEGATSTLPQIGTHLSDFMTNATPFIDGVKTIDPAALSGVKALTDIILTLTAAGILDSITSWLTGGSSLTNFAQQLVPFGQAMADFSKVVSGNIDEGAVAAAANAGAVMIALADTIPNTGGIVSWFTGDNDLDAFGEQIVSFGEAMVDFSKVVSGNIDPEAILAATNAGTMLAALSESLPESGGFTSIFAKDNDMSTFGDEIVKFGKSLNKFSDEITDVDTGKISSVVTQFKRVADMASSISSMNFDGLGRLNDALGSVSKNAISKFMSSFDNASVQATNAISNLISVMSNAINSRANMVGTAFSNLMKRTISDIAHDVKSFRDIGVEMVSNLVTGIKNHAPEVNKATKSLATSASTSMRSAYTAFFNAGGYLATGFAQGISSNDYKAVARSKAMASKALKAAEAELQIRSPSRKAYKMGSYYGLGFVNAIGDYADIAYKASSEMSASAYDGLGKSIANISRLFDGSIDVQPTIRPVLDLSDVKSGVSAISSMFNDNATVGVMANVSAINTMMMSSNTQNGSNDDVVSAIRELRTELGGMDRATYNINGVTYDDGSNISDAVRTIVRAAKIERRS